MLVNRQIRFRISIHPINPKRKTSSQQHTIINRLGNWSHHPQSEPLFQSKMSCFQGPDRVVIPFVVDPIFRPSTPPEILQSSLAACWAVELHNSTEQASPRKSRKPSQPGCSTHNFRKSGQQLASLPRTCTNLQSKHPNSQPEMHIFSQQLTSLLHVQLS